MAGASAEEGVRWAMDMEFAAEPVAIRRALERTRAALTRAGTAPDLLSRVELVLAEALNNVAEHAYGTIPGGAVRLALRAGATGVWLEIRDRGAPMPDGTLPPGRLPRADVAREDLPEGGFGWYLIHSQADSLEYGREGDENHLELFLAAKSGG